MTNTVAAWLAAAIVIAVIADLTLNSGAALFFLALKVVDLIDWAAFWR